MLLFSSEDMLDGLRGGVSWLDGVDKYLGGGFMRGSGCMEANWWLELSAERRYPGLKYMCTRKSF